MTGLIIKTASRVCILTLLSLTFLSAQAQIKDTSNLQVLVNTAIKYSPALHSREALINSSKADVNGVRDAFLPTAVIGDEALIGSDNSLPGSYLSMGVIPSTSSGIRSDNKMQAATGNFALVMSQYEIATFGYKNARIKNAEALVSLRQQDLDHDAYLLKWRLSKLYFSLQQQQLQLNIEAQNVKRYQELFTIIRAVTLSGLKAGADSSQALAELSRTKIDYNNALRQTQQLKQEISYLTGVDTNHIVADTLELANQSPATQLFFNTDSTNNPLIDYFKTQQAVYQSNEALVQTSYRPHVVLTGSFWARGSSINYNSDYKSLAAGLAYQRYNYMAGVSVFYNLFSIAQKRDRLAASRYDAEAGEYTLQQQQQSLNNESLQADEAVNIAIKNLVELPTQLQAATDAFNQKTAQYKAGIINLVDLTNATYVLYRAQTDYAQALNDWYLSNLDKAAVTGNLDLFIQTIK